MAARTYDPLGFLSPLTIVARILLQELWAARYGWDDDVNEGVLAKWNTWLSDMERLPSISIPRFMGMTDGSGSLHVFCDASESAYGAVAYYRGEESGRNRFISFVMARSKVAPLRRLTVPRLELQGAVLATRMAAAITRELNLNLDAVTFWTDSQVVLHWLKSNGRRFCTFVENRISEILDMVHSNQWRFVPGRDNPADVLSRGTTLERLKRSSWFSGPSFLSKNPSAWPIEAPGLGNVPIADLEMVHSSLYIGACNAPSDNVIVQLVHRSSQLQRLMRIVAWVRRAAVLFRSSTVCHPKGILSGRELIDAWKTCVKGVQGHCFSTEISCLRRNEPLQRNSRLRTLNPFMDEVDILRVGGRLHLAHLPFEVKHPPILPSRHSLSVMLVEQAHADQGHSGIEDTMAEVRSRAWVIDLRALVRSVVSKCVICRRQIGVPPKIPISWLPKVRVQKTMQVFAKTGVDFFGPFFVSVRRSTEKRWICLFTCLAVRAVHLEECFGLDGDSFLSALRRFTARRGTPAVCISDNGINFVAGERALRGVKTLNTSNVEEFMAERNIEWRFNPPGAPNFGGSWERLIGCAKRALAVVLKGRPVPEEVFQTVVVEVEGLLNGRPLTHVSSDLRNAEPLTPNHFLLGRPYASLPATLFEDDTTISRKRWKTSQLLVDNFWCRWVREYLPFLASLHKHQRSHKQLKEGDVVLVVDPNNARGTWPMGQIVKTYPGPDGIVRVVDVKSN